jgi:F0F1-type ATP synthase assembly protein I
MNKWMKLIAGLLIGIAVLSIVGILINVLVGLATFALKVIIMIAAVYLIIKGAQYVFRQFK